MSTIVETIYRDAIRPLSVDDQRRLAEMILERAGQPEPEDRRSVLDIIHSIRAKSPKRSASEIDEYLRQERESWDD